MRMHSGVICRVGLIWGVIAIGTAGGEDPASVVPKGARSLGIDVNEPADKDHRKAFEQARTCGVEVVNLHLCWDDYEREPNKIDTRVPAIANAYYPPLKTRVSLKLAPIDTNNNRLPADLKQRPLDDPLVIERFGKFIDAVLNAMPDVELQCVAIGNEIDVSLGKHAVQWERYGRLFRAAVNRVKKLRPQAVVGTAATFEGLKGEQAAFLETINRDADVIMVNYYPLRVDFTVRDPDVVAADFATITKKYRGRPIYFMELGYPSGARCRSSQEKQAQFIRATFSAWDKHADQVQMVLFTWLHDWPADGVAWAGKYYSSANPAFLEYIATLGLRTGDGSGEDKEAFRTLRAEARARGW
ncbi:MAG: glycosyl hydrolase 53 family protein [Planctomycetaceae bacterium]